MRLVALVLVVLLGTPALVFGQPSNTYRLVTDARTTNRHLGGSHVGEIRSNESGLYMESPRHTRLFAVEHSAYDNRVPTALGLELPVERLNLGYATDGRYRLKVAGTILRTAVMDGERDDFWALGLYPSRDADFSRFGLGLERNSDGTVHTDLTTWTTTRDTTFTVMTGVSWEQFESHGARSEPHRLGGALEYRFRGPRVLIAGSATGTRDDAPAWMAAAAHYVKLGKHGALVPGPNPGVFALYRKKPESTHGMFIFTLFNGPTVNEYVADGITASFFRGTLSTERVVGSRDFNTPVVGHGYENADMGLIVFSGVRNRITASRTARIDVSQYELAATYPWEHGRIADPYLRIVHDTETDIVYDPMERRLDDPRHRWWTIGVGARIQLLSGLDPRGRHRQGFLRLESGLALNHGIQGVHLKASFGV